MSCAVVECPISLHDVLTSCPCDRWHAAHAAWSEAQCMVYAILEGQEHSILVSCQHMMPYRDAVAVLSSLDQPAAITVNSKP